MLGHVLLIVSWLIAGQPSPDVTLQAATPTPGARATPDQEAPPTNGLDVYRAQYCGVCHTLDAAETKGPFGPTHNGMASTAARRLEDPDYTGKASTAGEYIRESIIDPTVYLVPGYGLSRYRMGAYTMLSEAELDALVQFLLEQR
jgi:nitric oxide reductase subunit C